MLRIKNSDPTKAVLFFLNPRPQTNQRNQNIPSPPAPSPPAKKKPNRKLTPKHLAKHHGDQAWSNCCCVGHGSTMALLHRPFTSAPHQTASSTQRARVHGSSCFLLVFPPPQCHNISWQISSKPLNPFLHQSAPWAPEIFALFSLCISKLLPEPSPKTSLGFFFWQFIQLPYPCFFACSNYRG